MYKYLKFVLPAVIISISQPANSAMAFDDAENYNIDYGSNDFFTPKEVLKLCLQQLKTTQKEIHEFVGDKAVDVSQSFQFQPCNLKNATKTLINDFKDGDINDLLEKITTSMHNKLRFVQSLDKEPILTNERLIDLLESPYSEFIEMLKSDENIDNLQQDEFNKLVSNFWNQRFSVKGGDYVGYQAAVEKLINLGVIDDIAAINEIRKNGNNFLKEEIENESAITSTGLRFANGPILWNIKQMINYRPIRKHEIDKDDF